MTLFSFPALAAGPPSKRNWYKELLDHPACSGSSAKVREAYQIHREEYITIQMEKFTSAIVNPVTPDQALIKHLERQPIKVKPTKSSVESPSQERPNFVDTPSAPTSSDELDSQDINCLVIWTRPPARVRHFIRTLQNQIASLVGHDLHLIPENDLHLSVIELSHRHSVAHLRSVVTQIGTSRIQNILDLNSTLANKPRFDSPQLSFDNMGIAMNFLPAQDDAYTYHHLRSDMHALALESGVSIDMCYTAPSAHITLGRFVGNAFFDREESRQRFVDFIRESNERLRDYTDSSLESDVVWSVGDDASLELQLGYLKYGRGREKADMLGQVG